LRKKRLDGLLAGIWIGNLVALVLIAGLVFWFAAPRAAQADSPNAMLVFTEAPATRTPRPSITPIPPATLRATITLWPTPSPGPSVTPMGTAPANRTIIGYSIEGRPQEVFRYGAGLSSKLIVAGIHGGSEWNTVALADELIAYLNDHPERIPENTTLYILRDLNPDGTTREHGVDGRVNAHGVDLNRNWPYNWVADWPRDGCWIWRPVTGGEYGGSEPEVRNLIGFIDTINPTALISYHSAALGIFPGGRPDYSPSIRLAQAVSEVSDYPYPPLDTGCDYTGNLTDWAANTRGIPSIDIELTNHRDTDFEQNLRVLQAFLEWRK
jgi:protein MpaA